MDMSRADGGGAIEDRDFLEQVNLRKSKKKRKTLIKTGYNSEFHKT